MAKRDAFVPFTKYRSYLNESTYTDVWEGKTKIPKSPVKARDCFIICKELKEKTNIPGFVFAGTPEFVKDREIDCIVLDVGPGYRVRGGAYPYHFDGQVVLNELNRGDIVRFLERAASPFQFEDELYYAIEEHKVYFAIDPDDAE